MKHVYVIAVQAEYSFPKISNEAYETLTDAQKFIEDREGGPVKLSAFHYKSARYEYFIYELQVR